MTHFRNKKREYLKDKNNVLANWKNKNIRDFCRRIKDLKKEYQHRCNLMKDEFCYVLAESHDILNWKNHLSQVLKIHKVSDVKQRKVSTCCCSVIRMQGKIMA
jgi:DNA-binding ferritin-like protein (Dps family)